MHIKPQGAVAALALLLVTAVWGLTFLQVKEAVAVYPLFLFLAVRFAIACGVLAPLALPRLRALDRRALGGGVVIGGFLAAGYAFQTVGLDRTTVSSAGFITGLYVPLTPICALLLFRVRAGAPAWAGAGIATAGLALLSGVHVGSLSGDALLVGCAAVFALEIVFMERFAPGADALAFTFVQMAFCLVSLGAIALVVDPLRMPHGWTVWSALVVTGIFASALAFLVQTWAQRTTSATRTALIFALEPVFAGLFGYWHGDRLGALGWGGCGLILLGIAVSEPSAATGLRALLTSGRRTDPPAASSPPEARRAGER
jgi:drug/metabolite transporter (DMT)-like permease